MKKIYLSLFISLLVFTGFSQTTVAKPKAAPSGNWKLLGTVTANHSADHDVIVVAGPHDYFRKLKFKVTNSPLNLQRLIVYYDDGGLPEKVDTRFDIAKGGESRVIDLKGGKRKLKSVEFWYDTKGILNGKANLTMFGMK
jgi:hypothetical protein